ncbi:MAG: matrixin family metalloprotease [Vicinamibacterales bacterium]
MSGRAGKAVMLATLLVVLWGVVSPTQAYLKLGVLTSSGVKAIRWTRPIQYLVTNRDTVFVSAAQLQTAVSTAFSTWAAVPNVSITPRFIGFTGAEPFSADGASVIGFRARPELDRTLAAATFELDTITGDIIESDIFFNTAFIWSVAPGGQADRYDLESVGVHEIGHLLGLGHSALGETEIRPTGGRRVLGKRAVMFPIAYPPGNIEDRTLEADDRSGIQDAYAFTTAARDTGTIGGTVRLGTAGVYGAHVTAFNTRTGEIIGGFALDSGGNFVIGGLPPGLYVVRVEPLDDADITSFFDAGTVVNTNFRPAYLPTLVAVPAGGSGPRVEIRVVAK